MSGRILLGITGGIAAYKSVQLVRLLTTAGYDVVPIMTQWATRFVGTLTLEALCGHPVRIETPAAGDREGIEHISLIRSARLLVVAPLTANSAAKMANGLADNFLTNTYLAHRGLTLACPAMNTAMLEHPATQRNLAQLQADGVHLLHGSSGDLACGEVGGGRMAEPEIIFEKIQYLLGQRVANLVGKKVLVSAGPTNEAIDPVRYITNRSSGKMGIAVARAFAWAGAEVTLVHGPVQTSLPTQGVTCVAINSAAEMAEAILSRQAQMDVIVMAAAVADYRPPRSDQKLKKGNFDGVLRLERTQDILATLGERKQPGQVLAGFAAESEDVLNHAAGKLKRKNLDVIFANDISSTTTGFGHDMNRITALFADGSQRDLGTHTKQDLATAIVDHLGDLF